MLLIMVEEKNLTIISMASHNQNYLIKITTILTMVEEKNLTIISMASHAQNYFSLKDNFNYGGREEPNNHFHGLSWLKLLLFKRQFLKKLCFFRLSKDTPILVEYNASICMH
jgi:hypothetical protein